MNMNIWNIYLNCGWKIRLSFRNCLSCVNNCGGLSSIQSFTRSSNIFFIYSSSTGIFIYELTIWPAPSWLDSSVDRALHRHRRGHGFESRSSLNLFMLSFRNCLSCVLIARIFLLFDLSSAVQNICFIYLHFFIHPSRVYYELTIWPAPSWLDSSVGRALYRHRRGHEFESRLSLNLFFRISFRDCLSFVTNLEDLPSI